MDSHKHFSDHSLLKISQPAHQSTEPVNQSQPAIKEIQMTQDATMDCDNIVSSGTLNDSDHAGGAARIETDTIRDVKCRLSKKTGVDVKHVPILCHPQSVRPHQAMADNGKRIVLSRVDMANDPALICHELVHIIQQNGGSRLDNHTSKELKRSDAENEANNASRLWMSEEHLNIHACRENALFQSDTAEADNIGTADTSPKETRPCAVFYLDDGTKEFIKPARRFVKTRPGRCYGWITNDKIGYTPSVVDMPIPFKTGKDIQRGLEAISEQHGKLYDIYIFGHGTPGNLLSASYKKAISGERTPEFRKESTALYMEDLNTLIPKTMRDDAIVSLHACSSARADGTNQHQVIPRSKLTGTKCKLYRKEKSSSRLQPLDITEESLNTLEQESVLFFGNGNNPHVANIEMQISGTLNTKDGLSIKLQTVFNKDILIDESFGPVHIEQTLSKPALRHHDKLNLPDGIYGEITISTVVQPQKTTRYKSLAEDIMEVFGRKEMYNAQVIGHRSKENEGKSKAGYDCSMVRYKLRAMPKGDTHNSSIVFNEGYMTTEIQETKDIGVEQKYGMYTHCRSDDLLNKDGTSKTATIYTPKGEMNQKQFSSSSFEED